MNPFPLRYLPWMVRDLALAQGVVLAAIGVFSWLIMDRIDPAPPAAAGPAMVSGAVKQMSLLLLLFCASAIVSNDRVHGYYRSFFSRPMSPVWYYFSRWVLGGIFFLLLAPVLTLGLSLALGSFPLSWELQAQLALNYLLLGGLIFFFSTLVRYDWLLAMVVLMVQAVLYAVRKGGVDLPAIWDFVLQILPPIFQTSLNNPMPTGSGLAHSILYGSGLVIAALALLRLRPLGAGGRS